MPAARNSCCPHRPEQRGPEVLAREGGGLGGGLLVDADTGEIRWGSFGESIEDMVGSQQDCHSALEINT